MHLLLEQYDSYQKTMNECCAGKDYWLHQTTPSILFGFIINC